jgi:pyruvate dehydrogenase E1 component alpha subunit
VPAEVEVWKHRDPIERFKRWLTTTGRADAGFFEAVEEESDELGASVRERCLALPDPPGTDMFAHVYAEPHSLIARERAEFERYQASFEGAH